MRPYRDEDDYWRIRAFLRQIFMLNNRHERSWEAARLDYWRWHIVENCHTCESIENVTYLWELTDGQIAAVLNAEAMGEVFFQVHPSLRSAELEDEMVSIAEQCLSAPDGHRRRKLHVWVNQGDTLRENLLSRRGYHPTGHPEYQRQRPLDLPLPEARPTPGYIVRSLGDADELPARSWASWRAFHPDEPDKNYQGFEWYYNVQRIPMYRRDLDLVAVARDGTIAGFCTIWYDDVTRSGCFEPVGIMPEYQRRGLGRAMMCEGMRRVQRMGATLATVAGFSPGANALYSAVMSRHYDLYQPWGRSL
jgi:GNAT superfamily N-acetyltransferase